MINTLITDEHELAEALFFATDVELAQAYDVCMADTGCEVFPLYMVTAEMQSRDLTFDQLEDLLVHQYDS